MSRRIYGKEQYTTGGGAIKALPPFFMPMSEEVEELFEEFAESAAIGVSMGVAAVINLDGSYQFGVCGVTDQETLEGMLQAFTEYILDRSADMTEQ